MSHVTLTIRDLTPGDGFDLMEAIVDADPTDAELVVEGMDYHALTDTWTIRLSGPRPILEVLGERVGHEFDPTTIQEG